MKITTYTYDMAGWKCPGKDTLNTDIPSDADLSGKWGAEKESPAISSFPIVTFTYDISSFGKSTRKPE